MPGAPHCFGNAAAGYDSCWSAYELCQTGSDLGRMAALQKMSEKRHKVHKKGWQVEAEGEKKKKGFLWWERSVAPKAHKVPCSCDAVNLLSFFPQAFWPARLIQQRHNAEKKTVWDVSDQHFQQSFIKKKKIFFFLNVDVFTWKRCVRQKRSITLMDLCSLGQIHHKQILIAQRCSTQGKGDVYHSLSMDEISIIHTNTGIHLQPK